MKRLVIATLVSFSLSLGIAIATAINDLSGEPQLLAIFSSGIFLGVFCTTLVMIWSKIVVLPKKNE